MRAGATSGIVGSPLCVGEIPGVGPLMQAARSDSIVAGTGRSFLVHVHMAWDQHHTIVPAEHLLPSAIIKPLAAPYSPLC